jgi:FixJ family two-component response regulator
MRHILLIDSNEIFARKIQQLLTSPGYQVSNTQSMRDAVGVMEESAVALVISALRLADGSGLQLLRHLSSRQTKIPVILVVASGTTREIVQAMRLGAENVIDKANVETQLLGAVAYAFSPRRDADMASVSSENVELHPVARWTQLISALLSSSRDTRTTEAWGRLAFVSTGTIRGWCSAAGISPRHSLVFGRLLRAVILGSQNDQRLENLLDVVDRRTLASLLHLAGFDPAEGLPGSAEGFLDRQVLVAGSLLAHVRTLIQVPRQLAIQRAAAKS